MAKDITAAKILVPVKTNAGQAAVQTNKLDKSIVNLKGSTKKASSQFQNFNKILKASIIIFIVQAIRKLIAVTEKQQAAEAQLNAVLKSTKQVAGLTATELKTLASSLQSVTTFGDEAIIGAQALLLTFTKVGKDVFPRATETILNMSQAMGVDLKTSAIQVGKALNDPIMGVSALRRVGVQLSESQEVLVKRFVETGQQAKAQAIILDELETQFGGAAEAASQTLGGALKQLTNVMGDLTEETGNKLTPVLVGLFKEIKEQLLDTDSTLSKVLSVFNALFDAVMKVIGVVVRFVQTALSPLFEKAEDGSNTFDTLREVVVMLGEAIEALEPLFQIVAQVIAAVVTVVLKIIKFLLRQLVKLLRGIEFVIKKLADLGVISRETVVHVERLGDQMEKSSRISGKFSTSVGRSSRSLRKYREEALKVLAGTGDLTSQLAVLDQKFKEQARIVKRAGLDVTILERFALEQRKNQILDFFKKTSDIQDASFQDRQKALEDAYISLLNSDKISHEARIAAQKAFTEQSKALERERLQAINKNVQLVGQVGLQAVRFGEQITKLQNAQIESQIEALRSRGATEEEIEQKRRELARKQAEDAKIFGIAQAIINTSLGVTKALASLPPPASFIAAALTAATGAVEIATIAATPIPAAQFGGEFAVPPGNEADSGLVRVNQGETLTVSPSRFKDGGQNKKIKVVIGNREFDAFMVESMNTNLNNGKVQIRRRGVIKTA
jgi:hypothetical protein